MLKKNIERFRETLFIVFSIRRVVVIIYFYSNKIISDTARLKFFLNIKCTILRNNSDFLVMVNLDVFKQTAIDCRKEQKTLTTRRKMNFTATSLNNNTNM